MNPVFGIILLLGLSFGVYVGKHRSEISTKSKEVLLINNNQTLDRGLEDMNCEINDTSIKIF